MSSVRRQSPVRARPPGIATSDEFRRMILLLETAAVLDTRAGRATDPVQAAVLRRRAGQRLREAESIRAGLASGGAAVNSAGRRGRT